jgi:hypothetical protein
MEKLTSKKPQTADGTSIEPTARWIRDRPQTEWSQ